MSGTHVTGSFETAAARPPQEPSRGSSPRGSSHLDHPGPVVEEVAQRPSRGPRTTPEAPTWTEVCHLDRIDPESGVAALVDGRAVAVFRTHDDAVHALDNYDPFCRASVLARGIVGTRTVAGETVPYVASPMFKQGFDLRTGQCLDDADVRVATYAVEVTDAGVVRVAGTT